MSMASSQQTWDPGLYDDKHAFVWKHGASLVELLAPQAVERILDLGCGTGHLTAQIAASGATVVGLDSSADMLEQARLAYPRLEFVQADARDFSLPGQFDAVFSNAALHWVTPPDAVIRCMAAALEPAGRLVAEFGGRGNVQAIVAAWQAAAKRLGLQLPQPRWFFPSVAEYASLLEGAGMEVTSATLFARPTPLEGSTGLREWLRMFASAVVNAVPVGRREEFLGAVEEAARPVLFRDGGWFADYRRLRIVAIREV
jgi:trans-aconitate methyltransferase